MNSVQRVAMVTGAGSGIGRAVALALAGDGFAVVLAGRRQEALEATASQASTTGAAMLPVVTDVTDPASVKALFGKTRETFQRLDLLFNNAGQNAPAKRLEDLSVDEWRSVLDTNLTGTFICTQEAIKLMREQTPQGGRIINNGSLSAHTPRPNAAAYTASKHGITGLTKSTALEGRQYGIACGQIDIGNAASPMASQMSQGVLQADGSIRPEPTVPVDEVARAVLYMASLPLNANVLFMSVMATNMPFVGRW